MLRLTIVLLAVVICPCCCAFGSQPHLSSSCTAKSGGDDPDTFAWRLFACLNRPTGSQRLHPAVYWETWPSPRDLYCDGKSKNCNPDEKPTRHNLVPQAYLEPIQQQLRSFAGAPSASAAVDGFVGNGQEVRLNDKIFDYVVDHELWYLQGQQRAFLNKDRINFPLGAIEIKAYWIPIEKEQRKRYLWRQRDDGQFFGLIAFNIAAKTQSRWFWTTFEHVDNPKRCAYTPCTGKFSTISGVSQTIQLHLSSELLALIKEEGMDTTRQPWWLNYRLHGTQTDFVDSHGEPTLLGNSVLEATVKNLSSCITCHSRATRDYTGAHLPHDIGVVGKPMRTLFCGSSDERLFLPLDYVWSLAQANPVPNEPGPSPAPVPNCGSFEWLP